MTQTVSSAATKRELIDALILRLAVAFDKASPRDLIALAHQLLDLLRQRTALDHEEREAAAAETAKTEPRAGNPWQSN